MSLASRPTLDDYARDAGESAHPELWRGLLSCWAPSLGEQGNQVRDVGPNKNHGTLTNFALATAWSQIGSPNAGGSPGGPGRVLDFDGTNDRVDVSSKNYGTIHTCAFLVDWRDAGDGVVFGAVSASEAHLMTYFAYIDGTNIYYNASPAGGGNFASVARGTLTSGTYYWLTVVRNGTALEWHKDGVSLGTATLGANNELDQTAVNATASIGSYPTGAYPSTMRLARCLIWDWPLPQPMVQKLIGCDLLERRRVVRVFVPAGGGIVMPADSGAYVLTGTAAALEYGRRLDAASGSYTLTGTAAGLLAGRKIAADSGAYTLTGSDAALKHGRRLDAASGSYSLTGTAAGLLAGRKIAADSGAYALTGQTAGLLAGRKLAVDSGSYTLTGTAAGLLAGRKLAADSGAYDLAGSTVALRKAGLLTANSGAYTLTGQDATLTYGSAAANRGAIVDATVPPRIVQGAMPSRIVLPRPPRRIIGPE
jgi:hypothetical protein